MHHCTVHAPPFMTKHTGTCDIEISKVVIVLNIGNGWGSEELCEGGVRHDDWVRVEGNTTQISLIPWVQIVVSEDFSKTKSSKATLCR